MHVFRGAMIKTATPARTSCSGREARNRLLEYLGFASLLHRRIDAAEAKRP